MSWAKPTGIFQSGFPLDRDSINETLARYSWEISYLDETNWNAGSSTALLEDVSANGELADDHGCTLYHSSISVSPYSTSDPAVKLPESTVWEVVDDDNTTIEVDTRGGTFLVFASFQANTKSSSGLASIIPIPGYAFAIGIDDEPQVESFLGSGDEGNDPVWWPKNRVLQGSTTGYTVARHSAVSGNGVGPGITFSQSGYSIQWAGALLPGRYRFSIMSRALGPSLVATDLYMTCREVIVMEFNA